MGPDAGGAGGTTFDLSEAGARPPVAHSADLPPVETRRWVASRKAAVVRAVHHGLLSEAQAMERYGLSVEELEEWMRAVASHGEEALKATLVQRFRAPGQPADE